VKAGATLLTDGHASYSRLSGYRHDPRVVGKMAGHVALPWIHPVCRKTAAGMRQDGPLKAGDPPSIQPIRPVEKL
jgi:hypothetical protein